jgi:hypothetical protein
MYQRSQSAISRIIEVEDASRQSENANYETWNMWIELTGQQRLLQCCYLVEYQQVILLARSPRFSFRPKSELNLPLPAHTSMWNAESPAEWALAVQQCVNMPRYIRDITMSATSRLKTGVFDVFQSLLIIADRYNVSNDHAPILSHHSLPDTLEYKYEPLLSCSPMIKHQLLVAKLVHVTPVRSLLAISGESWILSEKVPSMAAFNGHRSTLQSWVEGIRKSDNESKRSSVTAAVELAIDILQHAIMSPTEYLRLEFGGDMGLYFAVMVIWAITIVTNDHLNTSDLHGQPSEDFPRVKPSAKTSHLLASRSRGGSNTSNLPSVNHTSSDSTSTSVYRIIMDSIKFLENAKSEVLGLSQTPQWLRHNASSQQGCSALMRWVKMRVSIGDMDLQNAQDVTFASLRANSHTDGELLDGITSVLERTASRLSATQPFPPRDPVQNTSSLDDETPLVESSVESDWQTEDSMSDMDFSQSLTGLSPSVSLAAVDLYDQFQVWQHSRTSYLWKDQRDTD